MASSYAHATSIGRLLSHDAPSGASPSSFSTSSGRPRASSTGSWTSATTAARGNTRRCGFPECLKTAKPGGLCISHGGGKKCSVEGCTTSVVSRGFCVAHGGGKRCQRDGCTKSAQTGGFCWIHGGGKKCGHEGCTKRAQSGGACISHGGGKRCRIDGCNKVVQFEGLCVGHGGYRKCISLNCIKKALSNGYCQSHGGNAKCHFTDCSKKPVHGGCCGQHGRFSSPQQVPRSRSSSAGDSPVRLTERSDLRRPHDVPTISPLMPLPSATQQAGLDWSRAIHEAKHSSILSRCDDSGHRPDDSQYAASVTSGRGVKMMATTRLPTVEDMQRTCSLGRSVSPLKTIFRPSRLCVDRIAPLLSAVESATSEIKHETMDETLPRESLHSHHCADHTCGRFAKVDGLCLLHHHQQAPLLHPQERSPSDGLAIN